ncbi:hypothetical protein HYC85_005116 [Camellia sinensis]|uniref:H15 domain-containing protein n=1 Tax=Camellia sinensis TaxID=4442 RepID=A0A7J7I046_CAMSI|nr:hypothetical protein HYC85_005116 [Camellia sinensis]
MEPWSFDPPPPPPPPLPLPLAVEPPVHIAHAANPTPPLAPNNIHSHPPYAEMITAAITALKEKNGSSRQAIAKYIEKAYTNLPSTHSALLTHHLKRLKNNGHLVMVKYSYMLPRSVPISSSPPPPPPPPTTTTTTTTTVTANGNDSSPGPRRGPGRPPKPKFLAQSNPVVVGSEPLLVSSGFVDGPKKGPGRPPRLNSGVEEFGGPVVGKRGRGRPPRPKSMSVLMGQNGLKKGRGRPPRARPIGPAGLPRLKKAVSGMKASGRPRGRPPKNAVAGAAGGGGSLVAAVGGGVLPGKRRGRPPKAGGAVKKPRKLSGKPLGRPKKNGSMTAIQQSVAYEDLKNKIAHFQSRVKQAISMVKPHLNNETAVSAIAALQELEELATMDMNAPLNVQVQVQLQEPLHQY